MDAYKMFMEVRQNIGEESASHWTDREILMKLNGTQKRLWSKLGQVPGDWLVDSVSVTALASVITLPSDCAKPIYLEDSSGYEIPISDTVREKRLTDPTGLSLESPGLIAYPLGNTLVINTTGDSSTYTLWYIARYRDLALGVAGANSGANALHLEAGMMPRIEDDYYNDAKVRTYTTGTYAPELEDTITDYVGSTLIATVSGTPAETDLYGTVSQLPEESYMVMVWQTTVDCLAKPSAAIDPKYFRYANAILKEHMIDWEYWISSRVPGSHKVRRTETE